MFSGTYTALVTPFRNGKLDLPALEALIDFQIAEGISGLVPVGTTGESPTLTVEEHQEVIRVTVQRVRAKTNGQKDQKEGSKTHPCTVIAGTGSNSTQEAIELTQEAEKLGVDAALLVAPYYNKPTQEGLYQHYYAIAQSVKIPIILYSVPGRCGIEISISTVARLAADCPNIVAIKEAGGSVDRVSELRQALPATFDILSGDDVLAWPFIAVGAVGLISVASNLIPRQVSQLVQYALNHQMSEAQALHAQLYPLFKALFIESNPVPIKTALALQDRIANELRLPLCGLSASNQVVLEEILNRYEKML